MDWKGKLFTTLLSFTIGSECVAQSFYDWRIDRKIVGSLGIGAATYYGDINSSLNWVPSTLQLAGKYHFLNRLFGRAELSIYTIEGFDKSKRRNADFTSTNIEFSLIADYSLFPTKKPYYERNWFNPYVFLGIGFTYVNPKGEVDGKKQALRPLMTEGVEYGPLIPVVPFGGGIRIKLNYVMDLTFEGGFRYTRSDYLDDVSERANPNLDDFYWIMSVKFEVYLPFDIFLRTGNRPRVKVFRKFRNTIYE